MDVSKITIQTESTSNNDKKGNQNDRWPESKNGLHQCQKGPITENILRTPKIKSTICTTLTMAPTGNPMDLGAFTIGSPGHNKTDAKAKSSIKTNTSSPKPSPRRKRKRYLSNPGSSSNITSLASNLSTTNGDGLMQTCSPIASIKRRRRRSASLSINGSSDLPNGAKNDENLPNHCLKIDNSVDVVRKNYCPRPNTLRTPTKHMHIQNTGRKSHTTMSPSAADVDVFLSPVKNTAPNNVPPNTTVWGWSPIRGKFKPKAIECQNVMSVDKEDMEEAKLATAFKSKWQSVSLVKLKSIVIYFL